MAILKTVKRHADERKIKKKKFKYAQSLVPISKYLSNSIFLADDLYVKTWEFSNMNFKLLNREQEGEIFEKWANLLNCLEPGNTYKYTVIKKKIEEEQFNKDRLLPEKKDSMQDYRTEYNDMLKTKNKDTKFFTEKRYFQAITKKTKEDDARSFFNRSEPELEMPFNELGSSLLPINELEFFSELWRIHHGDSEDFYRQIDISTELGKKNGIKNYLAPYQYFYDKANSCLIIGGKYYRSLYVAPSGYATYIKDQILSEIMKLDKTMSVSIDIMPIESDEAVKMVEAAAGKIEDNISKFGIRQSKQGNYDVQIPHAMRKKRREAEEYNEDISSRDQRVFLTHVCLMHSADNLKELNQDTDSLKTIARRNGCDFTVLTYEQEDGLITALPYGVNRFIGKNGERLRTLTSESLATFIPFTVQDIAHSGGIYYGQNRITRNPLFINRKDGMNGNAIILGSSGSGKSFKKKEEMASVLMNTDDNIIIIDPEKEYVAMVEAFGGQIIKLSADTTDYINAMEISKSYAENKDPVVLKSEAILSLYSMAAGNEDIDSRAKSILDRCIRRCYEPFIKNDYEGNCPTLVDLSEELKKQPEDLAKDIALTLELYTTGSLNIFAKQTNVNMDNRIICFDISNLGENLMPISMLIVTDYIMNTLSKNRDKQKYTWIDIDELYLMFYQEYTAIFFHKLWKRIRKYGGLCTGITQELSDLLRSPTAKTMLANSDFLIILSVKEADAILISELLNISKEQMTYITNVGAKKGVIKLGNQFIPFIDEFPEKTSLYKLMSTKITDRD